MLSGDTKTDLERVIAYLDGGHLDLVLWLAMCRANLGPDLDFTCAVEQYFQIVTTTDTHYEDRQGQWHLTPTK